MDIMNKATVLFLLIVACASMGAAATFNLQSPADGSSFMTGTNTAGNNYEFTFNYSVSDANSGTVVLQYDVLFNGMTDYINVTSHSYPGGTSAFYSDSILSSTPQPGYWIGVGGWRVLFIDDSTGWEYSTAKGLSLEESGPSTYNLGPPEDNEAITYKSGGTDVTHDYGGSAIWSGTSHLYSIEADGATLQPSISGGTVEDSTSFSADTSFSFSDIITWQYTGTGFWWHCMVSPDSRAWYCGDGSINGDEGRYNSTNNIYAYDVQVDEPTPNYAWTYPANGATYTIPPGQDTVKVNFSYGITEHTADGDALMSILEAHSTTKEWTDAYAAYTSQAWTHSANYADSANLTGGDYNYNLEFDSETGNLFTLESRTFSVVQETENSPEITLVNPADGANISDTAAHDFYINASFSGTWQLIYGNTSSTISTVKDSGTFTSGDSTISSSINVTEYINDTMHWRVDAISDPTGITYSSASRNFTVVNSTTDSDTTVQLNLIRDLVNMIYGVLTDELGLTMDQAQIIVALAVALIIGAALGRTSSELGIVGIVAALASFSTAGLLPSYIVLVLGIIAAAIMAYLTGRMMGD